MKLNAIPNSEFSEQNDDNSWQDGDFVLLADELEAFHSRVTGKLRRMPDGFWGNSADREENSDGWERGLACARYLFKEIWHVTSREELLQIPAKRLLSSDSGIGGFKTRFNCTIWEIVAGAFPEYDIKAWEMVHAPNNYWQKGGIEAQAAALKWWLEQEGLAAKEVYEQIRSQHSGMQKRMAQTIMNKVFDGRLGYPDLLQLFQMIDPSIKPYRPENEKALDQAILVCPLCEKRIVRQQVLHLQRKHTMSKEEALAYLVKLDRPIKTGAELAAKYGLEQSWLKKTAKKGGLPIIQGGQDGFLVDERDPLVQKRVKEALTYKENIKRKKIKNEK